MGPWVHEQGSIRPLVQAPFVRKDKRLSWLSSAASEASDIQTLTTVVARPELLIDILSIKTAAHRALGLLSIATYTAGRGCFRVGRRSRSHPEESTVGFVVVGC